MKEQSEIDYGEIYRELYTADGYTGRSGVGFGVYFQRPVRPPMIDGPYALIGGYGITAWRDLKFVEENHFPQIRQKFDRASGKTVFLGNGSSTLPLYSAQLFARGRLSGPPTLVDLFDYTEFYRDLYDVMKTCVEHRDTKTPFFTEIRAHAHNVYELVRCMSAGHLQTVKYLVGSGNIPDQLRQAEMVVNIIGPPEWTLDEQLAMLAPHGKLYASEGMEDDPEPSGWERQRVMVDGKIGGYVFFRSRVDV